ncbi:MAG: GNAT family N-acetyltransferase [Nitrospirae bacterium]|nr:GNAT family N-acetyltransferase [Nitrospirota bacterium]
MKKMNIKTEIVEESVGVLPEYGRIPISFEVRSVFDVQLLEGGLKGFRLSERPVAPPWVKDYDGFKGEGPTRWADQWNISNWGVISAFGKGVRLGGCVIAHDTPGVHKLEGREDIAALWDIRVAPQHRGKGIGSSLIEAALAWSKRHKCRRLKVETQNINLPACRFYAKHGFTLGAINRYAYTDFPDEIELIWSKEL